MEGNGTDQLEYYLSSLNELGEVLIDADRVESVGTGILRLTLGTIMASKGAIFLYNKNKDVVLLSGRGFELENPLTPTPDEIKALKQYSHSHLVFSKNNKGLSGNIEKHLSKNRAKIVLPLFHKETFLGILCVGQKFMNQEYSEVDTKVLEIVASHLTKALFNYQLIEEVEAKKTEINLKLLELETLFDISVAISSVLDVDELCDDVLWRSVGILNASKGVVLLLSGESPILNTAANFNWDKDIPLLSKKHEVFKNIDQNKKGCIFSENEKNSIQKNLKKTTLLFHP